MAIVKHIYQRTISRKGKKIKAWYYWYKDADGKVVRKSCGKNKKPCLTKREAQEFIANIDDEDLINKSNSVITIEKFAKGIFDENSPYIIKQKNLGNKLKMSTYKIKKELLNMYIIPKFGNRTPEQINNNELRNWLLEFDRSNSWRNIIINIFIIIFQELYDDNLIEVIPSFTKFKLKTSSSTGILTREEITYLFPVDNYDLLIKRWRISKEKENKVFTYAMIYYMTLTMGLRSGEVRAIHLDQINGNYLILNRMLDSEGNEVDRLKKGTDENKRWRVVPIPEKTKKLLDKYIEQRNNTKTDYLFELYGAPIEASTLCCHFQICLKKNGIDYKARKLKVHSLRFTCNSMLRHHIPEDLLRSMIGHTSVNMTDYYDKADIEMKEDIFSTQLDNINKVW